MRRQAAALVLAVSGGVVGTALPFGSGARADTVRLTIADAVELAGRRSLEARRITFEAERGDALFYRTHRGLYPDLTLDLVLPEYSQRFSVAPLPSAPTDTIGDGSPPRIVYGKITTTSRNGSGALRFRQLLPWRGQFLADGVVTYHDEETTPEGALAPRKDYEVQASVGIDVPVLGDDADRRLLRHADLEWLQGRARVRSARAQLDFDTTSKYLALLRARLALDVAGAEAEQARQAEEMATRKVAAGLMPEVDQLRLAVFRADRESRLAAAETEIAAASDAMVLHLGLAPGDSIELVEPLAPFTLDKQSDAWVELALANRAEIGLLEQEAELLDADRKARRPWMPQALLSMRYGGGASETALDQAIESLSANDLRLRFAVSLPIWDSGRSAFGDEAARAEIELRRLDAQAERDRIAIEARDATRFFDESVRRHQILAQSSQLASEVLRITSERYERGLVDTQTFLGAQSDAAAARIGEIGSLLDLYQARARLRFVTLEEDS